LILIVSSFLGVTKVRIFKEKEPGSLIKILAERVKKSQLSSRLSKNSLQTPIFSPEN
jgi:hypothetical protein